MRLWIGVPLNSCKTNAAAKASKIINNRIHQPARRRYDFAAVGFTRVLRNLAITLIRCAAIRGTSTASACSDKIVCRFCFERLCCYKWLSFESPRGSLIIEIVGVYSRAKQPLSLMRADAV
jgi:hypothetical protein